MNADEQRAPSSVWPARLWRLGLVVILLLLLNLSGGWLAELVQFQVFPRHGPMIDLLILGAILAYILLMAFPFMPGIEIGLGLMMLFGSKGAVLVYLSTLAALSLSYLAGRLIPTHLVIRFLKWLHLERARLLVEQLQPLDQKQRLQLLHQRLPPKVALFLVRHRYLTIAVALNLPGNAVIGGGGGIGLVVGMSGLIPYTRFLALLVLVVAPVPFWFYLYGPSLSPG